MGLLNASQRYYYEGADGIQNSGDEKYGDYQFATMSNVKRRMIHELAAIYGFECISYNPEPYRYCHVFINGTQNITLPRVNFFNVCKSEK